MNARSSDVRKHYETWPFPAVEHSGREGLMLVRRLGHWCSTPGAAGESPRVLDAGCGTGHTTVALARRLPDVEFVGIDLSGEAIDMARELVEETALGNVRFEVADLSSALRGAARAIPLEPGSFRAVLALGVLHHVPDREAALDNLVTLLEPDGRLALWMYGVHGRHAHALHQRFVRLLAGRDADGDALQRVGRAFVEGMGERCLPGSGVYTPLEAGDEPAAWLAKHPEWLADQLFPAFERAVDLDTIFALLDPRDLALEHWLGVPEAPARWTDHPVLLERLESLPRRGRLQAIECLLKPPYYFVVARRHGRDG
jgi:SAM-dependent methyltransferase